jgi:excisionase family DNA binding protein
MQTATIALSGIRRLSRFFGLAITIAGFSDASSGALQIFSSGRFAEHPRLSDAGCRVDCRVDLRGSLVDEAVEEKVTTTSDYALTRALYSVKETKALLSIGTTTLYELIKRGELKPTKLGSKTLFYATDLAAFLAKIREPKAIGHIRGKSEMRA